MFLISQAFKKCTQIWGVYFFVMVKIKPVVCIYNSVDDNSVVWRCTPPFFKIMFMIPVAGLKRCITTNYELVRIRNKVFLGWFFFLKNLHKENNPSLLFVKKRKKMEVILFEPEIVIWSQPRIVVQLHIPCITLTYIWYVFLMKELKIPLLQ